MSDRNPRRGILYTIVTPASGVAGSSTAQQRQRLCHNRHLLVMQIAHAVRVRMTEV